MSMAGALTQNSNVEERGESPQQREIEREKQEQKCKDGSAKHGWDQNNCNNVSSCVNGRKRKLKT